MARISTYSIDPNVTPEDKFHGSDENDVTRNFHLGPFGPGNYYYYNNVVTYITECDTRALAFKYNNNGFGGNSAPQPGTIVANNESSNTSTFQFDQVTSFLVSKFPWAAALVSASPNHCTDIMNEHVGEKIIWYDIMNPNNYGIYQCTSWAVDATYSNFYNMGLSHVSSNGSLVALPTAQLYIIEIWSGADKTYLHTQSSAASVWTVNHGLGKYPSVQIETSDNTPLNAYGDITHTNANSLTITFSDAYTGKAHCN